MSQGQSQKGSKDMGTCGVCWATFKIQRATGRIHRHGQRNHPCPGSDKPPAATSANQPPPCSTQQQTNSPAPAPDVSSQATPSEGTVEGLTHPPWVILVSRIPRAARAPCRQLLCQIIRKIISSPNDKSAWRELLHFGPTILAKPKRGGANRNLSNIINKRTAAWGNGMMPPVASVQATEGRASRKSSETSRLAAAINSKLEAGNFRAAIRLICSGDTPAKADQETLKTLQQKHPGPATDRRMPCDPRGNPRFEPLQISSDDIQRALRSFPLGSSGGPDGLTPQHIADLLTGATDDSLHRGLVDLVNLMLAGTFDSEVNAILFGGRLIALSKKDGGVRPISVGYTLRRLAAKCANNHVIKWRSEALQPQQLGVGVSGGAEAAVHAARRLVQNLPEDHVIVKLDFSNAFNCIRRDVILDAVAAKLPEVYRLVHAAYSCEPILTFGEHQLLSREGAQQGDPLGSLEFCEAIHPLLTGLQSTVRIGFMDDITLAGGVRTVEKDVETIMDAASETGLQLNSAKCEIIMEDFTPISTSKTFQHFVRVEKADMTLLGSAVVRGTAQDRALTSKIDELSRAIERLSLLHSHDALVLLKNSLSMPKLLHLLRTTDCSDNPLLARFDETLRTGLSTILNVDLSDTQWLQASLPVRDGGLGIRSAQMLAPSAFLASAASTLTLQQSILPDNISSLEDESIAATEIRWAALSGSVKPANEEQHIQKAWDGLVTGKHQAQVFCSATSDVDKARLLAASTPHAGDWLHAPPITSVGLRLSDEAIRVAVSHRLGCRACEPHTCVCGKAVDARGLHGLACRRSAPRQQRHSQLNDILWRAVKRAQIPAVKEPVGLMRQDGKRPDGATLIPWARGKPMVWDVTVPDTFADSHLRSTATAPGAAANQAASNKTAKYSELANTHIFFPVAIETGGTWNNLAIELVQEVGRRVTVITQESRETVFLFQRMSMALQRGNAVSFQGTFTNE
jgi:hypothetical protein